MVGGRCGTERDTWAEMDQPDIEDGFLTMHVNPGPFQLPWGLPPTLDSPDLVFAGFVGFWILNKILIISTGP